MNEIANIKTQHFTTATERTPGYSTLLLVLAGLTILFIVAVKSFTAAELSSDPLLLFYAVFVTAFQLSRILSATFYKKSYARVFESIPDEDWEKEFEPGVSFVIPCKDEEDAIEKTVTKCMESDYPRDKIEVIVINDGSTDGTGDILRRLEQKYDRLSVVHWKVNRGKRHGMAEGFRRANGEIIIQLDSDSYINPQHIRTLIAPFRNEEIGAVCAHADPENADQNWITKMQAAYYFMSFRILKAAESTYGLVFCCSGCSSAYRRDIVMPIIDEWLNESFLGKPVTWGDDRGLTNWVIKRGYKTIYTDVAKAFTIVPETLKQFVKQQVRWKKGWFVNTIFASKFVMKTDVFVSLIYFFPLFFVTLITPFMATRALLYTPFFKGNDSFIFYIIGVFLIAILIVIYYRFVARENKYWPYLFGWAAINMVVLSFLLFYALATIQDRGWGTR